MKKIFFDLNSWGPLKNFKTRSGPYLGLALSIYVCQKTKLKSLWTVPLRKDTRKMKSNRVEVKQKLTGGRGGEGKRERGRINSKKASGG
jgi:hypothetical protein